jgi:hypothetical protein
MEGSCKKSATKASKTKFKLRGKSKREIFGKKSASGLYSSIEISFAEPALMLHSKFPLRPLFLCVSALTWLLPVSCSL